jgi:hypothetical protein
MKIPGALGRLVPAGLGGVVTGTLAWTLGSVTYGEYSALLAKGSLVNAACFHWSRHLVVFSGIYRFGAHDLRKAWQVSIAASVVLVALLAITSVVPLLVALLLFIYSMVQANLERAYECLRAHRHTARYVLAASLRPCCTLAAVAILMALTVTPSAQAMLLVVTGSAVLARIATRVKRPVNLGTGKTTSARALLRAGGTLVPTIGYLFISDGVARIALSRSMEAEAFGHLSAWADIGMPAIWVAVSAATWSMVPTSLSKPSRERGRWLVPRVHAARALGALVAVGVLCARTSHPIEHTLLASQLLGSLLACVIFPALVITGRASAAAAVAIGALLATATAGIAWPGQTWPFLAVNLLALVAAALASTDRSPSPENNP